MSNGGATNKIGAPGAGNLLISQTRMRGCLVDTWKMFFLLEKLSVSMAIFLSYLESQRVIPISIMLNPLLAQVFPLSSCLMIFMFDVQTSIFDYVCLHVETSIVDV